MKDKQSRKYALVINNSKSNGWTHEKIVDTIHKFKSCSYFCLADEKGSTYHTHLYMQFTSSVRFSTVKKKFPTAHIESARGTALENRQYILKEGKWAEDKKHDTVVPNTFYEEGDIPEEQQGHRSDLEYMLQLIKAGASNVDLIEANARMMFYVDKIEKVRQELRAAQYKNEFRNLDITYIYGDTGVGKTRSVLEKYGYDKVCRVTDYDHPFENYTGQDILLFDEYRSQIKISAMLCYCDGYPVDLPCRYSNRVACYTKVYIVSNIPLEKQYPNIQIDEPATWAAFKRRINHVIEFKRGQEPCEQLSLDGFIRIQDNEDIPF